MTKMYFRRKEKFSWDNIVARIYRYGKVQLGIYLMKEEDEDVKKKVLKKMRIKVKSKIDPYKKGYYACASPNASNWMGKHRGWNYFEDYE